MCDDYWFPEKSIKRDEHYILCLDQCSTFPAQVPPTAIISCPRSELSPILLPHICYHYSIFFLSLALTIAWGHLIDPMPLAMSPIVCRMPCSGSLSYNGFLFWCGGVSQVPLLCICKALRATLGTQVELLIPMFKLLLDGIVFSRLSSLYYRMGSH